MRGVGDSNDDKIRAEPGGAGAALHRAGESAISCHDHVWSQPPSAAGRGSPYAGTVNGWLWNDR